MTSNVVYWNNYIVDDIDASRAVVVNLSVDDGAVIIGSYVYELNEDTTITIPGLSSEYEFSSYHAIYVTDRYELVEETVKRLNTSSSTFRLGSYPEWF
jgi:hypothetical protein